MNFSKTDRELTAEIERLRKEIDKNEDFDQFIELRKKLSILLLKKEANDKRINGHWKNPKTLLYNLTVTKQ